MTFRTIAKSGLLALVVLAHLTATAACGADLTVDPASGDDAGNGTETPVRTIARAVRLAQPGDTIHLKPMIYHDWAAFYGKQGTAEKPITLDGHGATLEGCDPLTPAGWAELGGDLYRHDELLPLTDAIIDRWFFLRPDGTLNRMNRCSKGPSEPLKSPEALAAGEWTFVKDAERTRTARAGYIYGSFYLRLKSGQTLANCGLGVPYRPAGVLMHGDCRHLIVRNVTSRHPYNDGFNLSDATDIRIDNIRAEDCGDDGISAHGACRYTVEQFVSRGNATGICDTGSSETSYRHVRIERCIGFDLFFLDTGNYAVRDAVIRSRAVRPLYLSGRPTPQPPCRLRLENVLLERVNGTGEVRVSPNCELHVVRSTITGLDWQSPGGDIHIEHSLIGGLVPDTKPRPAALHLWDGTTWDGRNNIYAFGSARVGSRTIAADEYATFQSLVTHDQGSRLSRELKPEPGIGATPAVPDE